MRPVELLKEVRIGNPRLASPLMMPCRLRPLAVAMDAHNTAAKVSLIVTMPFSFSGPLGATDLGKA